MGGGVSAMRLLPHPNPLPLGEGDLETVASKCRAGRGDSRPALLFVWPYRRRGAAAGSCNGLIRPFCSRRLATRPTGPPGPVVSGPYDVVGVMTDWFAIDGCGGVQAGRFLACGLRNDIRGGGRRLWRKGDPSPEGPPFLAPSADSTPCRSGRAGSQRPLRWAGVMTDWFAVDGCGGVQAGRFLEFGACWACGLRNDIRGGGRRL